MSEEIPDVTSDVEVDDIALAMKYAAIAITDDNEGTLKQVGKMNPWHIETLKIITGSKDNAFKPLTAILQDHMNLQCDKIMNISGMTPGGHFLDTQGYIAHNDEVVVLAYRCTTSIFDWLTNLNTTSSQWEIEEDVQQGFSGYCSGLDGLCCSPGDEPYKPRVHTGFYNNFLSTVPDIKEYIAPLLGPDEPPRKLYVVGHSLGAGIATLAACYFLLEYDWTHLPHEMVAVTAGSPRVCLNSMRSAINEELQKKSPKVKITRIVRNKDVVPTVPPAMLGFKHVGKYLFIEQDNTLQYDANEDEQSGDLNIGELVELSNNARVNDDEGEDEGDDEDDDEETQKSRYQRKVERIPLPFRDHMPDFYLNPLLKTGSSPTEEAAEEEEEEEPQEAEVEEEDAHEPIISTEEPTMEDEDDEALMEDSVVDKDDEKVSEITKATEPAEQDEIVTMKKGGGPLGCIFRLFGK